MQAGFGPCVVSASSAQSRASCPARASDHSFSSKARCAGSSRCTVSTVISLCSAYTQASAVTGCSTPRHVASSNVRRVSYEGVRGTMRRNPYDSVYWLATSVPVSGCPANRYGRPCPTTYKRETDPAAASHSRLADLVLIVNMPACDGAALSPRQYYTYNGRSLSF